MSELKRGEEPKNILGGVLSNLGFTAPKFDKDVESTFNRQEGAELDKAVRDVRTNIGDQYLQRSLQNWVVKQYRPNPATAPLLQKHMQDIVASMYDDTRWPGANYENAKKKYLKDLWKLHIDSEMKIKYGDEEGTMATDLARDPRVTNTATDTTPAADTVTTPSSTAGTAATGTAGTGRAGTAQNQARIRQDITTINNAITGITQQIKPNLLPNQKAMLARELVNIMADNKKARPEAWQNAYATVKKVLQNVGSQVDATMPKGRQNVTKDLIAALNAGQTRNQLATGISKAKVKPAPKMAKSSTAGRLGKAAPRTRQTARTTTDTNRRIAAEGKSVDNYQIYFLNKLLKELDVTWNDIGMVIVESKRDNTYYIQDSKLFYLNSLLESELKTG